MPNHCLKLPQILIIIVSGDARVVMKIMVISLERDKVVDGGVAVPKEGRGSEGIWVGEDRP